MSQVVVDGEDRENWDGLIRQLKQVYIIRIVDEGKKVVLVCVYILLLFKFHISLIFFRNSCNFP